MLNDCEVVSIWLRLNPLLNFVAPKHQRSGGAQRFRETAVLSKFGHERLIQAKFEQDAPQADNVVPSPARKLGRVIVVRGQIGGGFL